jgi:gas vesicle protein
VARELVLEAKVESVEAEAALARLANAFTATGDKADVAAAKAEKFEKSYKDGQARKKATSELDALSGATTRAGDAAQKATASTSALTGMVMRFAAPAAVGAAVMSTLNWAGNLTDLSRATGIGTTALQKFETIGKLSGATMDQVANASLQLSNRLAGGDKSAARAMESLGLSTQRLINMSPDMAMLEFAAALAKVENPQQRVALAMDALGRSGGALLPTLMDLNVEWDKTTAKLSEDGVKALDDASDSMDRLMDSGKGLLATVFVPFAPLLEGITNVLTPLSKLFNAFMRDVLAPFDPAKWREWADSLRDAARSMAFMAGVGPGIVSAPPPLPGSPGGGFGMPTPAGAIPLPSNLSLGGPGRIDLPSRSGGGGARVLPFRQSTFALGSTAASIFGMANTPGGFNAGSLPFMASLPFLQSGASPISFANGSGLAGTVGMNAPGVGGGGLGGLLRGRGTQMAGLGLGLLSRLIPTDSKVGAALNMAGQGAQMGAMFGPWGMGIGAAAGGLMGLFTGGKAAKNARNAETSQVFEQFSSKQFIELQKQADKFGLSMEKALNAKTMKDFGAAVDEVNEKLQEMNDIQSQIDSLIKATTVDFDKMNKVVQEFGLDITKLGPAFQQAAIDKEAQRIIDAMAIMEKGGADMSGVLEGMADEISKVVQDSIKFGTTIPENMKPWIEELIKSGKLVDENGNKITDMSKIKFGAAMESDMSKLTKKLDELIAKLAEMVEGFNKVRDAATGAANADVGNPGSGNPDGGQSQNGSGSPGFATGGVAGRDFRRPGYGDMFPALLRRGETVLPPGVHRGGVSLSIGNMSVGGGYGSRSDAVEEIGDAVVRYIERRGGRVAA